MLATQLKPNNTSNHSWEPTKKLSRRWTTVSIRLLQMEGPYPRPPLTTWKHICSSLPKCQINVRSHHPSTKHPATTWSLAQCLSWFMKTLLIARSSGWRGGTGALISKGRRKQISYRKKKLSNLNVNLYNKVAVKTASFHSKTTKFLRTHSQAAQTLNEFKVLINIWKSSIKQWWSEKSIT